MTTTITFIGAGNMASSMIGGLVGQGRPASTITACDPNDHKLEALSQTFGINTSTNNTHAVETTDVIILAVKPQILKTVVKSLAETLSKRQALPLIVSVAAGITSQQIQQWLSCDVAIVRCMPNTPALVQQGASGLYANKYTSDEQKITAQTLLSAVGLTIWVRNEQLIDAVTAVSGSGPAYFFLFMEAMIEAGVQQGLDYDSARELTLQTALGAATLAKESDISVDELRRRVTSPGGTTEQAIQHFEQAGLQSIVTDAMKACAERSETMSKVFN